MNTNKLEYTMLFEAFSQLGHNLEPEVKAEIISSTSLETYQKDELILPYKDVCRNVYFITKGLTMIKFKLGEKERIRWFMMEGDVFISVRSFFRQEPSEHCIIALEDTRCIEMSKNTLDDIAARHPSFSDVRQTLTEHYYIEAEQKQDLLLMTATERCAYMFKNHHTLYNRVANYHMAGYLGMEQSTFSNAQRIMFREEGL